MPAHTITPPTFAHGPLDPQRWHQQTAIHSVCHLPCTVKTGIHPWREHLSKVKDAIECEHFPNQVSYEDELQSGRDPDEDDKHAEELPWDGFWQFARKLFGYAANRLLQQLSGWLVSDDFGGEDVGYGGPGLVWLHVVCGCEYWMYSHPCWMLDVLPNSLKRLWRRLMVEKWTFNSRTTALVDILQSACQLHAPSKLLWHCGLCFLLSPLTSTKHYYRYIPEYLIRIVITYIYYVLLMTAYYN